MFLYFIVLCYFVISNLALGMETDGGDDFSQIKNASGQPDTNNDRIGYDYIGLNNKFLEFFMFTWRN